MNNYVPYDLRSKLLQIEPNLDAHWNARLKIIFQGVSPDTQKAIQEQFLTPKHIIWNESEQTFSFLGHYTLIDLSSALLTIKMRDLAKKIALTLETLKQLKDVIKIADYLETMLIQIDTTAGEDDQNFLQDKQLLRKTFLYDAAHIIQKLDFIIPQNCRHLTIDEVRTFILEIYIKQQVLGYWFKTILPRQLKLINHSFFQNFIIPQQKIRDFEVIESNAYLFIIATSQNLRQNLYSIRRFMLEDKIGLDEHIYLNGAVLDKKRLGDAQYVQQFKWQVSRIITLQRQLSLPVIELMDKFHDINFDVLLPLLRQSLTETGFSFQQVIKERLDHFEKALTNEILIPFQHALIHLIRHPDEFDYCFVNMHRLFCDLIGFYRDFSSDPIVNLYGMAKIIEYKLIAYLKLLEKRYLDIFTTMDTDEFNSSHLRSQQAILEVKEIISKALERYKANQVVIIHKKRELDSLNTPRFFKIFDKSEKLNNQLEELKQTSINIADHAYLDIIRVPKKHINTTVYLEFESMINISDTERHYAFTSGKNGISSLPIIIQLPEVRGELNLQILSNTLISDLTNAHHN